MIGQTTNESQNINVIDSKEIDVNINKKINKTTPDKSNPTISNMWNARNTFSPACKNLINTHTIFLKSATKSNTVEIGWKTFQMPIISI